MINLIRATCSHPCRARRKFLLAAMACGTVLDGQAGLAQLRESLAGEATAQNLKKSIEQDDYNLGWGPLRFRSNASLGINYTDNVFYSHRAQEDVMVNPQVAMDALWVITGLNSLKVSLGLGYQWYANHPALNSDVPLVNPGSELALNFFVGDLRLQLHDRFSYQQDLFFNSLLGETENFYNFNNVGVFSRLDNQVGYDATWDLNKLVLSQGYNHEDFRSTTLPFEYLDRASEWFTATAGFRLGDRTQIGLEGKGSLHNYRQETVLNDHWQARTGPFVETALPQAIRLRAGGGYDTARYRGTAPRNSDFESYYAYASLRQETKLFTHSLTAGREHLLGDLANNLRTSYVRYSISSPVVAHLELGANVSFNAGNEFGGAYEERFTYYGAGLRAGWQFHKHWRADLSYEFRHKESDVFLLGFHRNRITLSTTYGF